MSFDYRSEVKGYALVIMIREVCSRCIVKRLVLRRCLYFYWGKYDGKKQYQGVIFIFLYLSQVY